MTIHDLREASIFMSKYFFILALTWLAMAIVFFLEKNIAVGVIWSCVSVFDFIVALISLSKEKKADNTDDVEIEEYSEKVED